MNRVLADPDVNRTAADMVLRKELRLPAQLGYFRLKIGLFNRTS